MKAESDRAALLVAVATVAGLLLRLVFALVYWVDKPLTNDEQEYLLLARSLVRNQTFAYPPRSESGIEVQRFGRPPVYPFFLSHLAAGSLVEAIPPSVPRSVKVGQSIVGALGIPLLAALAWRIAGPPAGVAAAFLTAVHPPLAWTSAYALSEVLYFVVVWASVLCLNVALDRTRSGAFSGQAALVLTAAVLGGIAALTRPVALAYLGFVVVWLAWAAPRRLVALFCVGATVAIAPWTVRNLRELERFVLVAPEGGVNFWVGNHPLAVGDGDMAANPRIKSANEQLRSEHPEMGPEELEAVYYRQAIEQILTHPLWWLGLVVRKVFYLFIPVGPSYSVHSGLYQAASVVPYLLLLPFAVAGTRYMRRAGNPANAMWLLFGSSIIVYLLYFPQERYRIPEIDPTLIVCAGAWLGQRTKLGGWTMEPA